MIKTFFLVSAVVALAGLAPFSGANGYKESTESCAKCHVLKETEAKEILQKLRAPDPKILEILPGPVKGLWEVDAEVRGQRMVVYVDYSKKYFFPGPLVEIATARNMTAKRVEELRRAKRVDTSKLPLSDAIVIGSREAPTRVAVFTDPG